MKKQKRIPKPILPMLVFKMTQEESNSLKNAPQVAVLRFSENIGTATNWYDMTLRLTMAKILVSKVVKDMYVGEEVVQAFDDALQASAAMRMRAVANTPQHWSATDLELSALQVGIDLVDELQDNCTRIELLKAHRLAQQTLKI